MPPVTYDLHGTTVSSELPLDAATVDGAAEFEFVVGPTARAAGRPEGAITSELEFAGSSYWLAERDEGWLLRFDEFADFRIEGRRICAQRHPDVPEEMLPLLLVGGVLAHVLSARGRLVLHASAVEIAGRAVAIVAGSGMGKSTTAAMLCAAGAPLITDDTLVIDVSGAAPTCFRGTTAIRLRASGAGLAELLPPESRGETADGRAAVRPSIAAERELELGCVVALARSQRPEQVGVSPLLGTDAVLQLLQNPRAAGRQPPERARDHFERSSVVAGSVPMVTAEVPEPGVMTLELAGELRAELERAVAATDR